eukprot:CAMPEP_0194033448 /NCGR_PEP_ID=MMETSP0009_2-20130614/6144_1 /TAXON_ID=210454 /ORGANISM="Grammatophora oceanica, Strain CCMP 410" /LENGTH=516 /DNA_ID=CAMNT_0038674145 /DNA_START=172 /DNA_END=1722 /DNA_ORIENTATION=-
MIYRSLLLISFLFAEVALGQDCACAPLSFTYTFDLTAGCSDSLDGKDGVDESTCAILTNSTDEVPAGGITDAVVLTLDENGNSLGTATFNDLGPALTGDSIEFVSNVTSEAVGGYQLILTGTDSAGLDVQQTVAVTLGSDCNIFPVLEAGDELGWGSFTDVGSSSMEFCPNQFECSCSPSAFTFTVRLSGGCNVSIADEDGISEDTCTINAGDDVTDTTPMALTRINLIETGEDGRPVNSEDATGGPFFDGDTFTYTSVSSLGGGSMPYGLQINSFASNALEQEFNQILAIVYSLDCLAYPVIEAGDVLGWLEVSAAEDPRDELCPISPQAPSSAPSGAGPSASPAPSILEEEPSVSPSVSPSLIEDPTASLAPSTDGTMAPSESPSESPSAADEPTAVPVDEPTAVPADTPTSAPTTVPPTTPGAPTSAPTTGPPTTPGAPTSAPTTGPPVQPAPGMSMSMSMSMNVRMLSTERMLEAMLGEDMEVFEFGRAPDPKNRKEKRLGAGTSTLKRLRR